MGDLFDGMNKMTDDELRLQIALFENANLTNVVKETGYRMVGGIRDLANAFAGAFGGHTQFEYEVKRVSDMVTDACLKLRVKSREELLIYLREMIVKIVAELSGQELTMETPRERVNKILVDEAAKAFSVEKYGTCAHKTDEIIIEYNNAFLKTLHNQLVKETPDQRVITDKLIQNRMNAVSIETKRQLHQRVMPKEFNGAGIGRVLRSEKETKYLREVLTYLGVEALDVTSAQVWTIIMAMKGLKRPTRMQLARFVWSAGQKYGRKYAISQDLLPGYVPADQLEEFQEKEKEFRLLMQQKSAAEKQVRVRQTNAEKQKELQNKDKERMDENMKQFDDFQLAFTELESKKDDYYEGKKSESESKSYYSQVNDTKRNLDRAEMEYERMRKRLHEQARKAEEAQKEYETAQKDLETIERMMAEQIENRKKQLQLSWGAYFYKFTFQEKAFHFVVTNLLREEQVNVESKLKEIHDAQAASNLWDQKSIGPAELDKTEESEEIKDQDEVKETEEILGFYCNVSPGKNIVIRMREMCIVDIMKKD